MPAAVYAFMLLTAVCASLLAGAWASRQANAAAVRHDADVVAHAVYMCPMHRDIHRRPCGQLCRVRDAAGRRERRRRACRPGRTTVPAARRVRPHADAEMRRLGGIQVSRVERTSLQHSVRLVGRVASAEAATYTVTAGLSGFVRDVSAVTTGGRVSKGEHLAPVVAPDAFTAMQSYVVALGAIDRLSQDGPDGAAQARISSASGNLQLRTEKLQDLGLSGGQIAEMRRTREIPESITIAAPADGFVLARQIAQGQRFERGTEWYRIADLSRVWIMAEVIGAELSTCGRDREHA